jgi:copper chaperone
MPCGSCEKTIEQAVAGVDGAEPVNADHEAGTVSVAGQDPDQYGVGEAIERVGYELP